MRIAIEEPELADVDQYWMYLNKVTIVLNFNIIMVLWGGGGGGGEIPGLPPPPLYETLVLRYDAAWDCFFFVLVSPIDSMEMMSVR